MAGSFPQVRRLEDAAALRARLDELGTELPVADVVDATGALAQPLSHPGAELANRFCILPMEGWDGTVDGRPTDLVRRRWSRFGSSGAALMWGGEAVAVDPAGRANPHQLTIGPNSVEDLSELRGVLVDAHREATDGGAATGHRAAADALGAVGPTRGCAGAPHRVPPPGARPSCRCRRRASC